MEAITKTVGETTINIDSVANAKSGKVVRTTSLKQQLVKAERDLKNMMNRKQDEAVINCQRQIIERLKQAKVKKDSKK